MGEENVWSYRKEGSGSCRPARVGTVHNLRILSTRVSLPFVDNFTRMIGLSQEFSLNIEKKKKFYDLRCGSMEIVFNKN